MNNIVEDFNKAIDDLLVYDHDANTLHGKVCLICDKFMTRKEVTLIKLKTFSKYAESFKGDANLPQGLRSCYRTTIPVDSIPGAQSLWDCLLSPRSKLVYKNRTRRSQPFIMCCAECKGALTPLQLQRKKLPRFAIANGLAIGSTPECLLRLNEVELALLSQARFRGHLFTYWGGCHKSIKGWHTFYDVNPSHTTTVINQVAELTQNHNIAVILHGPFTPQQKLKVQQRVNVNAENVNEAFAWLKANNKLYANLPDRVFSSPIVIDNSEQVEGQNTDIELKEEIKIVFPDGTIHTGGCEDGEAFERALADIRSKCGADIPYLTSRPSAKILKDYKDMNLMRAFPKQFPYGFGSHEDFNIKCSQNGFLKHLLSLSIPTFHEADFVLVIHNMFEKSNALSTALWQVKGGEKCDVTEEELNTAISRQQHGLPPTNGPGQKFLDSIKAVKKKMAHTNNCAQAAQAKFLSLTHHFGCPKVMFTVSFDDSLDIRILPLSGKEDTLEWIDSLSGLSPSQLAEEMDTLKTIRFRYPGICALNFENLLDLVLTKLVGDNDLRLGIFGKLAAYGLAVEEQGRKTLHAHILVYILGWNELLQRLQSLNQHVRHTAEQEIIQFVDSIMSTELLPLSTENILCFECKEETLQFVSPQHLRFLRHRVGCKVHSGIIATCPNCKTSFRANDIALNKVLPDLHSTILSSEELQSLVSYQVLKSTTIFQPTAIPTESIGIINFQFNHHLDQHTKTCFKKGDEGRCCLPDIPETQTRIVYSDQQHEVFRWNGEKQLHFNITVRPRRFQHDAFTNTHCKIMSASKAPCNSNVGITTGARSTIYASCYTSKGTQKEDTEEYMKMASYVGNRFQHERNNNTLFEGLSRLMGAVIVGTSQHVCAAPMAAYLVRNQSRFKFSVNFKYIPIRELSSIVTENTDFTNIDMAILSHDNGCFLTNEALHYLHRPLALEKMCVVDFFQEYEIVIKGKQSNSTQPTYDFDDHNHPGYSKQIIRKRHPSKPVLAQFSHWLFPDAASFGGNIFQLSASQINQNVEDFCLTVLLLYHPFRSVQDITLHGSYHQKLLQLFPSQILPPNIDSILDNIQMFYNSMHLPPKNDPLLDATTPFTTSTHDPQQHFEDTEEDAFVDGFFDIFHPLQPETHNTESGELSYCLLNLRKAGARRCGFDNLPSMSSSQPRMLQLSQQTPSLPSSFIITQLHSQPLPTPPNPPISQSASKRDRPTLYHLMELTIPSTRRRLPNGTFVTSTPTLEATGTARSIIKWSQQPQLNFDAEQTLAFQIVTAAFVLTYYEDSRDLGTPPDPQLLHPDNPPMTAANTRHNFTCEKTNLAKLARLSQANPTLRMFLDGPAGSGKSHVVKALLGYAEAYTSNLGVTFDMRTIVVTALSGVAATSIGGETLHSAAAMNRNIDFEKETSWINARLLIIDECSFMNVSQVATLDEKLCALMHRHNAVFGGLHILFCGDFRQLEPVTGTPLYSPRYSDKQWVNSINCYIELQGLHRFRADPEWGMILRRLRNATHTQHDLHAINACVIGNRTLPNSSSFCVYANCDRSAINAGIFSNFLTQHATPFPMLPHDILVVRGSKIQRKMQNGSMTDMHLQDVQYMFQNCGDFRLTASSRNGKGHFVDPLLKLYHNIPLMFVTNDDVPNGHANGTRVLLQSVVLCPGCSPDVISIQGHRCYSTEAHSVLFLICTLDGNPSKIFHVPPKITTCHVRAPLPDHFGAATDATINFRITMTQLPVLVNNATTGHKLQGQTKESLVISVWSKKKNWNYVALSRVTTRDGLFLVSPLPHDVDFSMSRDLIQMLQILRMKQPEPFDLHQ